ncbi:MAG: hypothetical protein AAF289_03925 [Cyanobacteria bacterium P01_A01_bin.135]
MDNIQLEIEGQGAIAAAEELLSTGGIQGQLEPTDDEPERDLATITAIATIASLTLTAIELAEKIYGWYQAYRQRQDADKRIEKVLLIGKDGQRILLADASVEQIRRILE